MVTSNKEMKQRWMKHISNLCYLLILWTIGVQVKCINKRSPTTLIRFLDATWNSTERKRIQSTLDCFATMGSWQFDYDYYAHYRPDLSVYNNSMRLVPCFPSEGYKDLKARCNKVFEGNMTFYQWKVPKGRCSIPYRNFDLVEFCRLYQGRSILFVGDSMMELMVSELSYLSRWQLYGETWQSHQSVCYSSLVGCRSIMDTIKRPYGIQKKNESLKQLFASDIRLIFRRNDILSFTKVNIPWTRETKNIEDSWIDLLNRSHPQQYDSSIQLVVLNRGIHFEANLTKLLSDIRFTLSSLREWYPHMSIVWRSTVHGHYEAMYHFFEHPLQSYNIKKEAPKVHPNFHYHEIEAQNRKVSAMLTKEFPEVLQLDVLPSTKLRRGGHRDKLHYCIPGPMDQWNELLLAVLRIVKSH